MAANLHRRLAIYVGSLLVLTTVYTLCYQWGMATYEGEPRTWYAALEVVIQSMTSTGYGQDAPWETLQLTALMIVIQLTGIAYIFVAFPLFVVPWLRTLVQPTPPTDAGDLADHVIVVGYTPVCRTLVEEFDATGTAYVVVEPDGDQAQALDDEGLVVIHGDPTDDGTLAAAHLADATAVVVDATDREFITAIVEMDSRDVDAEIFAIVADPARARYLRYAGVDAVISPKHRLGKALADKQRSVVDAAGLDSWGDLELREYAIAPDADLVGEPLVAARRVESGGATVLGAWVRGDFFPTLPPAVRIDRNTTLLVAATDSMRDSVASETGTTGRPYRPERSPAIVVGTGVVGSSAIGTLQRADIDVITIDVEDGPLVDVVGDATEEETLVDAGIETAGAIVLTLDDDRDAIVATLVARALNPDVECLVAVNRDSSVGRLRSAGADYALAIPSVAGRMLVEALFDRESMTFDERVHVRSVPVPHELVGALDRLRVRDRTGCSVLAIERDGTVEPDVRSVTIGPDDRLVIAGTEAQIASFSVAYDDE